MSEKRSGHPYWVHETIMGCGDVLATWGEEKQQRTVTGACTSRLAALAQCHAFQRIAGILGNLCDNNAL